ncbi:hypothetical protein EOM39_07870, partial [Candidatus Gracilibacteria bacterium]|nr:hypothetical protein [Candidatus Gracilibacteria bacterium]
SRDGKRIADINSIQKSLEIYITEKGIYPIPDHNANITYSGATAWIEGTVGDGVMINIKNINKKPIDPLTENEYTYSITSGKTEYQIGAISEGGQLGYKLPINQTHAAVIKNTTAMIRGTYNEKFLRVQNGSISRILSMPSIIVTDITQTDIQTILNTKNLVYNNYQNVPHSYNNMGYIMTGGFNYTNTNPLIYSGSLKSLTESNTEKLDFITKLKVAYNGTILQGEANYQDIVNIDPSNQTGAVYLVNRFINTNVGGIKTSNVILPTIGGTTETAPDPFLSNCTANGQIYYADSSGNKLATVTNAGVTTWVSGKSISDLTCEGHIIVCSGNNAGYTLQACNLGSSTVGATNSSAAYGNYFQWGNNGGTPSGTLTPSTTLVNTISPTTYGPGNYYN